MRARFRDEHNQGKRAGEGRGVDEKTLMAQIGIDVFLGMAHILAQKLAHN